MTTSSREELNAGSGRKYLTFGLGAEQYAIPIDTVREIIPMMPITRVPRTPGDMLGVINLRGKIIPVFDLHKKLQMGDSETTRNTCIIVVTRSAEVSVGVVVDRVCDVATISDAQIAPPPTFAADIGTEHLTGISTGADAPTRLLLAIDKILASDHVARP